MKNGEPTTVAIVQEASAVLDLAASLEKASDAIGRAASLGAKLVAFPETWLTCYPAWVFGMAGWQDPEGKHWYAELLRQSPVLGGVDQLDDGIGPVRQAALEHNVTVVLGLNERAEVEGGTLFNSVVTIGPDGTLVNRHRKLTPTLTERIVWAEGDASGLRVVDTPVGRVGSLVCWEHWHPLARHALHAQQEQIHVASWPDMTERHLLATRSYAFEGNCFVVAAAQFLRPGDVPPDLLEAYLRGVGPDAAGQEFLFDGGSCVVGPDGEYVVEPQFGTEGIITATLDGGARSREQKALDVSGHYSRPDIFTLSVDRRRRSSIDLHDD